MLHDKTEGWAAGLILLAGAGMEASTTASPGNLTPDKLFDYFANEIFNKTDSSLQDVLLKTSFLQKIDAVMAEKLTGNALAGQILERMSRNHYFTQKYGQAYQYHPLFREFLQSRAQANFSSAEVVALQRKAAELLEQSGSGEEAVGLFLDATDWDGAERTALNQAPLLASQGRSSTLEGWLHRLPPEYLNNAPWSLYWLGICRIAYNPVEARGYLENAFLHFKKEKDVPGVFLAWASIIDTIIYEWGDFCPLDHWIKEVNELIAEYPEFPSQEIEARVVGGMLSALTWWQSDHPDLPRWAEKAKQIALHHPNIELRIMLGNNLIYYYLFSGAFAQAALLMDVLKPFSNSKESTPLTQLSGFVVEVIYAWCVMADHKMCVQAVTKGMKHAQEYGIHLLDLQLFGMAVYSGVTLGDPSFARTCLEKMAEINSPRIIDQAFFHYQTASLAWRLGDLKKSIEHGTLALQIIEPTGCKMPLSISLIELALTLFDDGQHEETKSLLVKHDELAHAMTFITYTRLLYGARFAFELGEEEEGLALLRQGLAIGAQQGYVNMYRWHDRTMSRLCAKALEHDIETAYVKKLIRTRGLVPEDSVEQWPYPIKLYTLGRFGIELDGKPLRFTGKVQKKPLELLAALVSFGGREVSEAHLCEALWEDAEADAAHTACAMALHRLRKLLGDEEAVLLSDNRLSLNPGKFWVDAWAFERVAARIGKGAPTESDMQQGMELYQGTFLGEAASAPWALAAREKLRVKFMRFATHASRHCLRENRHEEALRLIDMGLEAEPLAEELYRSRMQCEAASGRRAEALATYRRCETMLATVLGIEPSDETRMLYQALKENRPLF
jgi:DNA-binding SARP family transcriptional activator